jgi:hypothetical protein
MIRAMLKGDVDYVERLSPKPAGAREGTQALRCEGIGPPGVGRGNRGRFHKCDYDAKDHCRRLGQESFGALGLDE